MKRNEIVKSLLKEGFSEKTLVNFSDRQLLTLASRMLGEADIMISKKDPLANQKITDAKKQNKSIETYEEEMKESSKKKPSSGLSKEKKSETVKKAKKGEDIGKKGKGFEKIVKKAKESGAEDPEAVAASAMWKNIKREGVEIKKTAGAYAPAVEVNSLVYVCETGIHTPGHVFCHIDYIARDQFSRSHVREDDPTEFVFVRDTYIFSSPYNVFAELGIEPIVPWLHLR